MELLKSEPIKNISNKWKRKSIMKQKKNKTNIIEKKSLNQKHQHMQWKSNKIQPIRDSQKQGDFHFEYLTSDLSPKIPHPPIYIYHENES